tara:strand:+ start:706 stop:915 length:210 start_codon:yes stop_codon:yes gene_type:complete
MALPIVARAVQMSLPFVAKNAPKVAKEIKRRVNSTSTRKKIKGLGTDTKPGPYSTPRSRALYDSIQKHL